MSEKTSSQSSINQSKLDQLLADYLNSVETGPELDRHALIAANPELAADLRSFFQNRDAMERVAQPLKAAIDAPTLVGLNPGTVFGGSTIRYFGDYELLEEIARGGMGVVYKARQVNLNRIVALKMILAGQFADDSEVKRFYAEAEAAARLDHPGIVSIFEIGRHDDQHYFSMAYVEGTSLAKKVADGPLPPRDAAELVLKVAEAVQFAHEKGIIHRDLKPANVLLDAGGTPRVTDFGLAKQLGGQSDLTGTGQVLGTPSYMPPEQAAGRLEEIGPASDVYSLGAILYCLLTGRPAFQSANPVGTLKQVLEQEPVAPRQLNAQVPRDLETICLKCLEKSPAQRYATATELHDELGRYLRGEPIHARPVSWPERTWRWCRRQPVVAGLMGTVAATLIAGICVSSLFAFEANRRAELEFTARQEEERQRQLAQNQQQRAEAEQRKAELQRRLAVEQKAVAIQERDAKDRALEDVKRERDAKEKARAAAEAEKNEKLLAYKQAEQSRQEAEVAREQAESALYFNRTSLAYQYWLADNLTQSKWALNACPDKRRGWEWHWLDRLHHGDLITLPGNGQFTNHLQVGQHPNRLACFAQTLGPGVNVWDLMTQKPICEISQQTQNRIFSACALAWDGKTLAMGEASGAISLWDVETGKLIREFKKLPKSIGSLSFSPDGKLLAAAGSDNRNGERLLAITEQPRNEYLVVWDVTSGAEVFRPRDHGVVATFSPDGSRLLTIKVSKAFRLTPVTPDLFMTLFDTANWTEVAGPLGTARSSSFSLDGKRLALGGTDRGTGQHFVRIFDPVTGKEESMLSPNQPVGDIALSPDGKFVVVAEFLGSSRLDIWDLKHRKRVQTLRGHSNMINSVTYLSDGRLASSSWDQTVKVWDPRRTQQVQELGGGSFAQIERTKFSPDGKLIAFAQPNTVNILTGPIRGVTLLNATNGKTVRTLAGHENGTILLAFNADGTRLVSGGRRGDVKVWDVATGKVLTTFKGPIGEISALAISPDGKRCVSAHEPPEVTRSRFGQAPFKQIPVNIKVWDVQTGKELRELVGHPGGVSQLAWSPDGRVVVSATFNLIRIWDHETGTAVRDMEAKQIQGGSHDFLGFSPDGKLLITAGYGAVQFWNVDSGQSQLVLRGHQTGNINGVAFHPDGSRLATASGREVKLWDTRSGLEILTLPPSSTGDPNPPRVTALGWSQDGLQLRGALHTGAVIEWSGR